MNKYSNLRRAKNANEKSYAAVEITNIDKHRVLLNILKKNAFLSALSQLNQFSDFRFDDVDFSKIAPPNLMKS